MEDAQRRLERQLGDDRPGAVAPVPLLVDAGPVVDRRDQRAVLDRFEPVAVVVADAREPRARDLPRDVGVLLVRGDRDGHVVLAHREVAERLTVHVDDEGVADGRRGLAGVALQHSGRVDGDVTARAADDGEDRGRVGGDGALELEAFAHHGILAGASLRSRAASSLIGMCRSRLWRIRVSSTSAYWYERPTLVRVT